MNFDRNRQITAHASMICDGRPMYRIGKYTVTINTGPEIPARESVAGADVA